MQRIDGSTAALSLPAPSPVSGTPGYFTEGNPQTATAPTIVSADWLNLVQEEIVSVVLAGGLQLDKGNRTQMRDAISALINAAINALVAGAPSALNTLKELADAINDDANFAASVTNALGQRALASRVISVSGGLLTGGGNFGGDIGIGLLKALAADIRSGIDGQKVITPAELRAAAAIDGQTTMLPDGTIRKRGQIGTTDNSGIAIVTFNTAFPNACTWASACNDGGTGLSVASAGIGLIDRFSFRVNMTTSSNVAAEAGTAAFWEAEGY